ncbi:MAG: protein kinase [Zavarzinella sp.]
MNNDPKQYSDGESGMFLHSQPSEDSAVDIMSRGARVDLPVSGEMVQANLPLAQATASFAPEAIAGNSPVLEMATFLRSYELGVPVQQLPQSTLFEAIDRRMNLPVLIRMDEGRQTADYSPSFRRELQVLARLHHPCIPTLLNFGLLPDGKQFLVTSMIPGIPLDKLFGERLNSTSDRDLWLERFAQLVRAMVSAHQEGVVHGALSPTCILCGPLNELAIVHWSKAFLRSDRASIQQLLPVDSKTITCYTAPEWARNEQHRIDERIDVFSLGSILCEILTGTPAFLATPSLPDQVCEGNTIDALNRLSHCGAPGDWIQLAKQCLQNDPNLRPANAFAVLQYIHEIHRSAAPKTTLATKIAPVNRKTFSEPAITRVVERTLERTSIWGTWIALAAIAVAAIFAFAWYRTMQAGNDGAKAFEQAKIASTDYTQAALKQSTQLFDTASEQLPNAPTDALKQAKEGFQLVQAARNYREIATVSPETNDQLQATYHRGEKLVKLAQFTVDLQQQQLEAVRAQQLPSVSMYRRLFESVGIDLVLQNDESTRDFIAASTYQDSLREGLFNWLLVSDRASERSKLAQLLSQAKLMPTSILELAQSTNWNYPRFAEELEQLPPASSWLFAQQLTVQQKPVWARDLLLAAVKRYPTDYMINIQLGELTRGDDPASATAYYTAALASQPGDLFTQRRLADAMLAQGDTNAANSLRRLLALQHPKSAVAQQEYATQILAGGNVAEAKSFYQRAIAADPGDTTSLVQLGKLALEEQQPDQALQYWRTARAFDTYAPEPLLRETEYLTGNKPAEADELLQALLLEERVRYRMTFEQHLRVARLTSVRGYDDWTLTATAPLLASQPNNPELQFLRGHALVRKDRREGLELLQKIASQPQAPIEWQLALANAELQFGMIAQASKHFTNIQTQLPTQSPWRTTLLDKLRECRTWDSVGMQLPKALAAPEAVDAKDWPMLAEYCRRTQQYVEAVKCYQFTRPSLEMNELLNRFGCRLLAGLGMGQSKQKLPVAEAQRYRDDVAQSILALLETRPDEVDQIKSFPAFQLARIAIPLQALSDAEKKNWQTIWNKVDQTMPAGDNPQR